MRHVLNQAFLISLGCVLLFAQPGLAASDPRLYNIEDAVADYLDFEPREKELVDQVISDPMEPNFEALAAERRKIANEYVEIATEEEDEDALDFALYYAASATDLAPNNVLGWMTFGDICSAFSSPQFNLLAIDAYRKAAVLKPGDPVILSRLASAYTQSGKSSEALRTLENLFYLKEMGHPPELVSMMTLLYIKTNEIKQGIRILSGPLRRAPEKHYLAVALGLLHILDGDLEVARTLLEGVAEKDSGELKSVALDLLRELEQ